MKPPDSLIRQQAEMKAESESMPMRYPAWLDEAYSAWKRYRNRMTKEFYERDSRPAGDTPEIDCPTSRHEGTDSGLDTQ